ncbi:hypothetical protein 8G_00048 [Ralstonia phage Hyacinthe]|uniref:Phage recombination protein Bet n=3 Tax=Rahariannevirus raharianne TaxID=2846050 RepID=A0A7G5BBG3_9CAUD|nr:RecT-like ssDNA annealing protein [Ralstonia phage Raharianne]QMV32442.1 hypothetical protein U2_00067 [Ralstonia phage Albius]QMV33480.1 hypothetical protein 8G_00048 [Ralstonia phage Hyacinthe]QMV33636.1 hypothetical protein Y2_00067 [Ralstonia phage Raharianne]
MSAIIITQAEKLGTMFGMDGNGTELIQILKATAFKGTVTDAQMAALMVVANQYKLNPFTRELFAFPDKNNGIVPVVGVDGWSRIINEHPQFDGIEFEQDDQGCTCVIYRKDRNRPIKVTEYMAECRRSTGPWQSHPRRMLRHKAMIQCARLAFGYGGIYDQDEAERIVEATSTPKNMGAVDEVSTVVQTYSQADFEKNLPAWEKQIVAGKLTAEEVIQRVQTKAPLTDEQKDKILSIKRAVHSDVIDVEAKSGPTYAQVAERINSATTHDALDALDETIGTVTDAQHRSELVALVERRRDEIPAF